MQFLAGLSEGSETMSGFVPPSLQHSCLFLRQTRHTSLHYPTGAEGKGKTWEAECVGGEKWTKQKEREGRGEGENRESSKKERKRREQRALEYL